MFALSSLPGLSIETRTSKFVTLSFSTPIGEICVTWPSKTALDCWRTLASVFPEYDDPLLEESGLVMSDGDADRRET